MNGQSENEVAACLCRCALRDGSTLTYTMGDPVSIRLDASDRSTLEAAARRQGSGLSTFVRNLAGAEAQRLRREAIRAEGERVVAYLADHAEAQAELEEHGTPISELP